MALYESTFIIRQDVSTQEVEKIADNFEKIIEKEGGKLLKREYWGLRTLSHRIKKNKRGHYVFFGLEIPSVKELTRKYMFSEDVLRDLTVRVDSLSKNPSPLCKNKNTESEANEK